MKFKELISIEDIEKGGLSEDRKAYLQKLNDSKIDSEIRNNSNSLVRDELGYVAPGLLKLDEMIRDCDNQFEHISEGADFELVDRVVKLRKYLDKRDLEVSGLDHVVVGGLFIVYPMYFLKAELVQKVVVDKYNTVVNPTSVGIPDFDKVNYATIRKLSSDTYIAASRNLGGYFGDGLINNIWNYTYVYS